MLSFTLAKKSLSAKRRQLITASTDLPPLGTIPRWLKDMAWSFAEKQSCRGHVWPACNIWAKTPSISSSRASKTPCTNRVLGAPPIPKRLVWTSSVRRRSHLLALHLGLDCGAVMEEHSSVHQPHESVARLPASYARIDTTSVLTVRYTTRAFGRWYLLLISPVLPLSTNRAERCTESISPSHE